MNYTCNPTVSTVNYVDLTSSVLHIVDNGDYGYNPPTSSYQVPLDGAYDSYVLANQMQHSGVPLHNGGEFKT